MAKIQPLRLLIVTRSKRTLAERAGSWGKPGIQIHSALSADGTSARGRWKLLVRDKGREEISEEPEENQTANAVSGKNPGAAAGKVSAARRLRQRLLGTPRDVRSAIFHSPQHPHGTIAP